MKIAVVTGTSTGIGLTTSLHLARNGYQVFAGMRNLAKADALQAAAAAENLPVTVVQLDVCDTDSVKQAFAEIEKTGPVDVLINNASSFYPTPLQDATEKQWNDLLATNTTTPLFLIKGFQEGLKKTKGSVINISDSLAPRGIKNFSLYSSAKGALETLTKSLAKELAPEVRINAVAPGIILWPENGEIDDEEKNKILKNVDLGRAGDPIDISSAVYFLTQANYITGQTLRVDGGRS